MTMDHRYMAIVGGVCQDCKAAETAVKSSMCWACGHRINHALGHDCEALGD